MFNVKASTYYVVDCYRDGKLIWSDGFPNTVVTVGKSALLDSTFGAGSAAFAWFVGLVNVASFSAYAVTDTMASHAGWLESTNYSDVTRRGYVPTAASAGSMNNFASRAQFNINGTVSIKGAFMTNNNTKGGTTGILYGAGSFTAQRNVVSGDILQIGITLSVS
jgi:hypothetical protein